MTGYYYLVRRSLYKTMYYVANSEHFLTRPRWNGKFIKDLFSSYWKEISSV